MRRLLRRLHYVVRRNQYDAELREEMQLHRELAGARAFGNDALAVNQARDVWIGPSVQDITQDLRFALRVFARDRRFTAGVVVVLALGLAVNTTIFTIVNGMTWRTLPVERGDQIVQVSSQRLQPRREGLYTSYADFRDWRSATRTFSDLGAYASATMNLGDETKPADKLAGVFVSSNAFRILRIQPVLGRDFAAEHDVPGASPVVLLGHHVWTARYGADPTIIGRTIRINGTAMAVLGVMPDGFQFPLRTDVWQPLGQLPGLDLANRDQRRLDVFGRLRDDVTVGEARADIDAVTSGLAAQYPDTNKDVGARTSLFTHAFVAPPPEAQEPLVMMIAAAIVLLIACANGANLLLARAAHRAREIAMRATLGASRFRIARQLLVEALLMAVAAAVVGLGLARLAVHLFARETRDLGLPYWIAFEFDTTVFIYVAIVCLGTAIVFGLSPAWQLSKTNVQDMLKDGGRGALGSRHARRWTGALLVGELALTMMLLGAAGVLVRSSAALGAQDELLDLDELITAQVGLPAARYDDPDRRRALHARLHQRFDDFPALAGATLSSARPFVDSTSRELLLDGDTSSVDRRPLVQAVGIGESYFDTLGVPLGRGRSIRQADGRAGREAVVINERFAEVYFAGVDPIGRRIGLREPSRNATAPTRWFEIVGVSPSIRQRPMSRAAPVVYLPLDVHLGLTLAVTVRGAGDLARATVALRDEFRAVDADIAIYNLQTLRRLSELSRWPARVVSLVLALFALIASGLSAAGLYGLLSYGVAQRTSEIGLRVALGARRSQIAWLLLRTTLVLFAIGLSIGLAGAFVAGQLIRGVVVDTASTDLLVLGATASAMAAIGAVACFFPARRAVGLDPIAALRQE